MTYKKFGFRLLEVTLLCIIWAVGLYLAQRNDIAAWTYTVSIATYVIFSLLIFGYTRRLVDQDRMHSFNGLVSISFLIKLVLSVGIIWGIEEHFTPIGNSHIFHYLFIYIVYTIFEVYFLTKLSYT